MLYLQCLRKFKNPRMFHFTTNKGIKPWYFNETSKIFPRKEFFVYVETKEGSDFMKYELRCYKREGTLTHSNDITITRNEKQTMTASQFFTVILWGEDTEHGEFKAGHVNVACFRTEKNKIDLFIQEYFIHPPYAKQAIPGNFLSLLLRLFETIQHIDHITTIAYSYYWQEDLHAFNLSFPHYVASEKAEDFFASYGFKKQTSLSKAIHQMMIATTETELDKYDDFMISLTQAASDELFYLYSYDSENEEHKLLNLPFCQTLHLPFKKERN